MNKEEYFKILNSSIIVREWQIEDIEKMSIVEEPANDTMLQFFKNEKQRIDNLITFSASDIEKHTIKGMVMRSGQWIPRYNIDNKGNFGYCYFSKETVKKMCDKFFSNKLTINHSDEITGDAILVNSWLQKNTVDGKEVTEWWIEYKVLTKRLWEWVKTNPCGFSLEGWFSAVQLSNK